MTSVFNILTNTVTIWKIALESRLEFHMNFTSVALVVCKIKLSSLPKSRVAGIVIRQHRVTTIRKLLPGGSQQAMKTGTLARF